MPRPSKASKKSRVRVLSLDDLSKTSGGGCCSPPDNQHACCAPAQPTSPTVPAPTPHPAPRPQPETLGQRFMHLLRR